MLAKAFADELLSWLDWGFGVVGLVTALRLASLRYRAGRIVAVWLGVEAGGGLMLRVLGLMRGAEGISFTETPFYAFVFGLVQAVIIVAAGFTCGRLVELSVGVYQRDTQEFRRSFALWSFGIAAVAALFFVRWDAARWYVPAIAVNMVVGRVLRSLFAVALLVVDWVSGWGGSVKFYALPLFRRGCVVCWSVSALGMLVSDVDVRNLWLIHNLMINVAFLCVALLWLRTSFHKELLIEPEFVIPDTELHLQSDSESEKRPSRAMEELAELQRLLDSAIRLEAQIKKRQREEQMARQLREREEKKAKK